MPYEQKIKQFNFRARTVHERGEHTLTLKFIGDLDCQYNSFTVMYTIKLNNNKTILSQDHR